VRLFSQHLILKRADRLVDTNGDGRLNDEVRAAIEAGCQAVDIAGVGSGRIDAAGAVTQVYEIP